MLSHVSMKGQKSLLPAHSNSGAPDGFKSRPHRLERSPRVPCSPCTTLQSLRGKRLSGGEEHGVLVSPAWQMAVNRIWKCVGGSDDRPNQVGQRDPGGQQGDDRPRRQGLTRKTWNAGQNYGLHAVAHGGSEIEHGSRRGVWLSSLTPSLPPFIHPSTPPSIYSPTHFSISPSIHPPILPSIHPPIHPPISPFSHPSIHPKSSHTSDFLRILVNGYRGPKDSQECFSLLLPLSSQENGHVRSEGCAVWQANPSKSSAARREWLSHLS